MIDRRYSRRAVLAAALFVVIFVVQVGIPAAEQLGPRPARFGWQMYSTLSHWPEAWTEGEGGSRIAVDVTRFIADGRAEIDWRQPLADALCADEDVRAVIVLQRGIEERVPCR